MKLHIGVDSKTGLAHSAVVTAANIHDKHPPPDLLHGQEEQVYGDCAYAAQQTLIRAEAPRAQDLTNKVVRKGSVTEELERMVNRAKSRTRARVEHVFGVVKRLWGFSKVLRRPTARRRLPASPISRLRQ
jgi:IS5 family transposase